MSGITTHVLDTSKGRPATGVPVVLEVRNADGWKIIGTGKTDADGRLTSSTPANSQLEPGTYRLIFDAAAYFRAHGVESFYPEVSVTFIVHNAAQHYHVPLLLSPYGYTTYRGS